MALSQINERIKFSLIDFLVSCFIDSNADIMTIWHNAIGYFWRAHEATREIKYLTWTNTVLPPWIYSYEI